MGQKHRARIHCASIFFSSLLTRSFMPHSTYSTHLFSYVVE